MEPIQTESNGRDNRGRFAKNNKFATGNPMAKKAGQLRISALRAVSSGDIKEILKKMVEQAKAGDCVAARIVLERCLGQPVPHDLLERIERLESQGAIE